MFTESVYNLIEKPVIIPEKPPRYKSKFPGNTPPTCSTFGLINTSKPGVTNVGGEFVDPDLNGSAHKIKKDTATFGIQAVKNEVNTSEFLKKGTIKQNFEKYTQMTNPIPTHHIKEKRKDPVPLRTEKPIMGLVTEKNFIVANAVENILSVPKKPENPPTDFLNKPEFGKVPQYLGTIKQEIQEEKEYLKTLELERQKRSTGGMEMEVIPEEERLEMLSKLQERLKELKLHYDKQQFAVAAPRNPSKRKDFKVEENGPQTGAPAAGGDAAAAGEAPKDKPKQNVGFNIATMDRTKQERKEGLEAQIDELEKAIEKLQKKNIYVVP